MAIPKRTQASFWDTSTPSSKFLKVTSKGIDVSNLEKEASEQLSNISIKPEKGYSFIKVITTGAGEFYGNNSNFDWFNEKGRTVKAAIPKEAKEAEVTLDGGLMKYHNSTFKQHGGVYKNHQNSKKGFKPEGTIVEPIYNEKAHRGEVIIKLANDTWGEVIEKVAKDEPVYWSIGAGVPWDICSICLNKRTSANDMCEHLKFYKNAMDDDGNLVFAYNDKPHFHDISQVIKPADRIAFTLTKLASDQEDMSAELNQGLYLPDHISEAFLNKSATSKKELLEKLAKIEKSIIVQTDNPPKIMDVSEDKEKEIVEDIKGFGPEDICGACSDLDMLLPPSVFFELFGDKDKEGFIDSVPTVFSDLLGSENCSEAFSDLSYDTSDKPKHIIKDLLKKFEKDLSINPDAVQDRVVSITIKGPSRIEKKKGKDKEASANKYLAKEYAKYQLAFLADKPEETQRMAILANQGV